MYKRKKLKVESTFTGESVTKHNKPLLISFDDADQFNFKN